MISRITIAGVGAHALAAAAGATIAIQVRLNSELAVRIDSGLVATAVSFAGALAVAAAIVCVSPRARAGARGLRRAPGVAWWTYLAGFGGAAFMVVAVSATPTLGVAMVSIAALAGQLGGGLVTDHAGLGAIRRRLTSSRLAGAAIALVAVAIAHHTDGAPLGAGLGTASVVVVAGVGIAFQAALNGRLRTAASPAVATTINYAVGSAALAAVLVVLALAGGLDLGPWPTNPLLYAGGALGAAIIAAIAVSSALIGVLRMTLAMIVGQLTAAGALDAALAGGPGISAQLVIGAALTVVAVAIAGHGSVSIRPAGVQTKLPRRRLVGRLSG